jgi:hypothetical protein
VEFEGTRTRIIFSRASKYFRLMDFHNKVRTICSVAEFFLDFLFEPAMEFNEAIRLNED